MTLEKTIVTSDLLNAEMALELPRRDMLLVNVIITNLLNGLSVDIDVNNNNIAVQVCAIVNLLNGILGINVTTLTCEIGQKTGGGGNK
jgi:hypothetical protein